ncbi:hypothetical protein MAUB_18540 [Mycolicibacterium aubagnense]|uniref:Uncharacterized protein n=1 Tax=Mycolicibacterium aubagnense TaxID=319707 RepID=A0ABN5YQY5_9MYCO|nr:hypothetical protein MAUB_18540 [Mycolicibacterium aubagnense]
MWSPSELIWPAASTWVAWVPSAETPATAAGAPAIPNATAPAQISAAVRRNVIVILAPCFSL